VRPDGVPEFGAGCVALAAPESVPRGTQVPELEIFKVVMESVMGSALSDLEIEPKWLKIRNYPLAVQSSSKTLLRQNAKSFPPKRHNFGSSFRSVWPQPPEDSASWLNQWLEDAVALSSR
jgi:hypothetical protein